MDLRNYFSTETYQEIEKSLSPDQVLQLGSNLEIIDNYSDASSYDEVMAEWMDEQGIYDTLQEFIGSYKLLKNKLIENNLTDIPPYQAVMRILDILGQFRSWIPMNKSLEEYADKTHDNEPRPSRMERPNISGITGNPWKGFYIGDQLENILVDKYGKERGEKMFNGLLDTGNNAVYKVCTDIMKEKWKMLQDLGENPYKMDYEDVNYFNVWKLWVKNHGRKANKLEEGQFDTPEVMEKKLEQIGLSFNLTLRDMQINVDEEDLSLAVWVPQSFDKVMLNSLAKGLVDMTKSFNPKELSYSADRNDDNELVFSIEAKFQEKPKRAPQDDISRDVGIELEE